MISYGAVGQWQFGVASLLKVYPSVHSQSPVFGSTVTCPAEVSHFAVTVGAVGVTHVLFSPGNVPSGQPQVLFTETISPGQDSHIFVFALCMYFVFVHTQFGYVPVASDGHLAVDSVSGNFAVLSRNFFNGSYFARISSELSRGLSPT